MSITAARHQAQQKYAEEKRIRAFLKTLGHKRLPKNFRMLDLIGMSEDSFYNRKKAGLLRSHLFLRLASWAQWENKKVPVFLPNGSTHLLTLRLGQCWYMERPLAKKLKVTRSSLKRALFAGEKADQWTIKTGPAYSVVTIRKHLLFGHNSKKPNHHFLESGPISREILKIDKSGENFFPFDGKRKGWPRPKPEYVELDMVIAEEQRKQVNELRVRMGSEPLEEGAVCRGQIRIKKALITIAWVVGQA